jgi:hypothetical protein
MRGMCRAARSRWPRVQAAAKTRGRPAQGVVATATPDSEIDTYSGRAPLQMTLESGLAGVRGGVRLGRSGAPSVGYADSGMNQ